MGLIRRLSERILTRIIEGRSSLENPQTPLSYPAEWLLDIFNGGRTDSGIRVSEMTALQVGAVLTCVNIIGNGVASLPLNVYEKQIRDNRLAKRLALNHVVYDILHDEPNVEMTSHTFRKVLQVHALLWGNGYAEIQRNGAAQPIALWPRNPSRCSPVRLTSPLTIEGDRLPVGTLVYKTSENLGTEIAKEDSAQTGYTTERIILAEDMVHVVGLSLDGRLGQSVVNLSRQIIGLALATEKYGAKFFGNGAVPRGILEIPGSLEPKAIENLRRSWQEAHGGENAHKTAVLEQGVVYKAIAVAPEQSQLLETRKHQRMEIASIFQVPTHMLGEGGSTKSSVEQSSIEFLNYTLQPWLVAWQQELSRKLFSKTGRVAGKYFVKFDTHNLLYPDAATRGQYYSTGKNWGYLSTNDIHELEDMNPVEDPSGDKYWMPVNMQDAADPMTLGPKAQAEMNPVPAPEPAPEPPPVTEPIVPNGRGVRSVRYSEDQPRDPDGKFGEGSGSGAEAGKGFVGSVTKEQKVAMAQTLSDWQDNKSAIANAAEQEIKSLGVTSTLEGHRIVEGIRNENTAGDAVHRGMVVVASSEVLKWRTDDEVAIMPTSFSKDEEVAADFIGNSPHLGLELYTPVMLSVHGKDAQGENAHGMSIGTRGQPQYRNEKEVISGGMYKVEAIKYRVQDGLRVRHIQLRQTKVF